MPKLIGWDVGGAHLKAVLLSYQGEVEAAEQLTCSLWLGLDQLEQSVMAMLKKFAVMPNQVDHAVTMTGELVDLFSCREQGVIKIAQSMSALLGDDVRFYKMHDQTSHQHFVTIDSVPQNTKLIASANWYASATQIAKTYASALFVDIGSTTTDIIPIVDGRAAGNQWTDAQRLQENTLIYTGVVRTPVMAIAQTLRFENIETNVVAEYFATSADIYRLTGELPDTVDLAVTADNGPKTPQASARRLARMIGYDLEDKPFGVWQALAYACRDEQLKKITLAMEKHLQNGMTIVGAGAGNFLVKYAANQLNYPYVDLNALINKAFDRGIDVCFPAYAVAKIAFSEGIVS